MNDRFTIPQPAAPISPPKKFHWGPVTASYYVAPYFVIEYHPQIFENSCGTGKYDQNTSHFHPYEWDGEQWLDLAQSYLSIDGALAGAIAHHYEGSNHRADGYFIDMLEARKAREFARETLKQVQKEVGNG